MKRTSIILFCLALIVTLFPLSSSAQEFPEIAGEIIEPYSEFSGNRTGLTVSPDGNWYAYYYDYSMRGAATYVVPTNGGETLVFMDFGNDTWMDDADDIVINGYRSTGTCHGLEFSPDGSKLVAGVEIFDTTKGSTWEDREDGRSMSRGVRSIVTLDIYTGEITYIADGQNPCWSADGRYIIYENYDYRMWTDYVNMEHMYELTKYDTVTGDIEFIEPMPGDELPVNPGDELPKRFRGFDIGPDNYIYFAPMIKHDTGEYPDFTLARVPVEGGEIEELIEPYKNGYCASIQVSSDGKWILFSDSEDVLVADIETGDIFNAMTGEEQYQRRSESFGEYTYMRLFKDPYFYENETKICYFTVTVDGNGTSFGIASDMLPEEQVFDGCYVMDFDPDNYVAQGEDVISAIDEQPEAFLTLGAFPNPFNPNTTLQFTLPEAGYAELTVFNFAGQKVRTLTSGEFSAGVHAVPWNGCDQNGVPVSSGIYLSRLTYRDNVVTSRMTLVK